VWLFDSSGERVVPSNGEPITCLAASPITDKDSNQRARVAAGYKTGRIEVAEGSDGWDRISMNYTSAITSLALSPDVKGLISGSADQKIEEWSIVNPLSPGRRLSRTLSTKSSYTFSLSPDGQTIAFAAVSQKNEIVLFDRQSEEETTIPFGDSIQALSFNP